VAALEPAVGEFLHAVADLVLAVPELRRAAAHRDLDVFKRLPDLSFRRRGAAAGAVCDFLGLHGALLSLSRRTPVLKVRLMPRARLMRGPRTRQMQSLHFGDLLALTPRKTPAL